MLRRISHSRDKTRIGDRGREMGTRSDSVTGIASAKTGEQDENAWHGYD